MGMLLKDQPGAEFSVDIGVRGNAFEDGPTLRGRLDLGIPKWIRDVAPMAAAGIIGALSIGLAAREYAPELIERGVTFGAVLGWNLSWAVKFLGKDKEVGSLVPKIVGYGLGVGMVLAAANLLGVSAFPEETKLGLVSGTSVLGLISVAAGLLARRIRGR